LPAEIEKVLKKVSEGVELFQSIFEKLATATNPAQREKYEGDLKKEIKKLQRFRDQIRTWLASNEIKDKRALEENRRLIEQQMERFKAAEKELKTKAFSKEGLNLPHKIDPLEAEKDAFVHWVNKVKDELIIQMDAFETEQEQLAVRRKGKSVDPSKAVRLGELEKSLERHKWHLTQLEIVLRMFENGKLTLDTVNPIKDDVQNYIDTNQDPDFMDDDAIYDDLELEDAEIFGIAGMDRDDDDGPAEGKTQTAEVIIADADGSGGGLAA
ncbi:CCR4-Not complex component, Not N-terminal domain-containing protein, partial [Blyttiomyces helicus]